jgi:hypothetical protein
MRKMPIDFSASTRSSGIRRPASISAMREPTSGANSRISASMRSTVLGAAPAPNPRSAPGDATGGLVVSPARLADDETP